MLAWMAREKGIQAQAVWSQIDALVAETMKALVPELERKYQACMGSKPIAMEAFQLLGLDIMFDTQGKPWLAEVNSNPDMGAKTDVDLKVKHDVLQGTLEIVCDGICQDDTFVQVL